MLLIKELVFPRNMLNKVLEYVSIPQVQVDLASKVLKILQRKPSSMMKAI